MRDARMWDAVADETTGQTALRDTADYRAGLTAFARPVLCGE